MSSLKTHTASGQALGYFFQLERALSWLAKSDYGSIIGIETEDDVVVKLSNGGSIYEQDKNSTSKNSPFRINSSDFWKTLLIWLKALENHEIDQSAPISFYLVTNKIVTDELIIELHNAIDKQSVIEVVNQLRKTAVNTPDGISKFVDSVLQYNDDQLAFLIKRISLIDGSKSFDRSKIKSDLQLPVEDSDYYITHLLGFILETCINAWRNLKPALIYRDDFVRLKNKLIQDHLNDTFNEESIKIADIAISNEKEINNQYIKQLQLINLKDSKIIEAIEDYLKGSKTRTVMATKGYIWEEAFNNAHKELIKRWESIYNQTKRLQGPYKWTDEEVGQDVLDKTLEYKVQINGYPTRTYSLTRGSYHLLANDLSVGWHPDYETLLKTNSNE